MDESSTELDRIRERKRMELLGGGNDKSHENQLEPIPIRGTEHFSEVIERFNTVLVDFQAEWCGPCHMQKPILKVLAGEPKITIAEVDIDRHQDIAQRFSIQSVPTLIFFKTGEPIERLIGLQDEHRIRELFQEHS